MKYLVVLLLAFVALSFQVDPKQNSDPHQALFEQWIVDHQKEYSSMEEKGRRFLNFKASISRVNSLNQQTATRGKGATYGLNKFSDMTTNEFKNKILMKERKVAEKLPEHVIATPQAPIPATFDWRNKQAVTPVKDQGQCGSCWAFSATETIESSWILYKNITAAQMKLLSPQQIVDCDTSDDGCGGGDTPTAYEYVIGAGGLDTAASYPYTAEDGTCAFQKANIAATINNWHYATTDEDEDQMRQAMFANGPLSICLDAANWQDYTSGVMTAWECAWINELDHCVQAVGYDTTASTPYWFVRNSWGTGWGINGYILLEYNANTCGLATEATYVDSS